MTDEGSRPTVTPNRPGGGDRRLIAIVIGSIALAILIILALGAVFLFVVRST